MFKFRYIKKDGSKYVFCYCLYYNVVQTDGKEQVNTLNWIRKNVYNFEI